MSLGSTETSSEVPEGYAGMLASPVDTDDYGNVTNVKGKSEARKAEGVEAGPRYPKSRYSAMDAYVRLAAFLPDEARNYVDINALLDDVEKVRVWLDSE